MSLTHPPHDRPRRPGFLDGLAGPLAGVRLVREQPRLWTWIVVPLLVNVAAFAGLLLLGWHLTQALHEMLASASWGWLDGLREFLAPVLRVLLAIVSVLAALLVTLLLSGIVNAPFYDLLSEQAERVARRRAAAGGRAGEADREAEEPERPWSATFADAAASVRAALSLALLQAGVLGVLFLLSFTAVGAPLFVLAGFFFAGFSLADITLARHRLDAPARRRWAGRHVDLLLGLGLPVSLLPPLAPFAVVGATLLCLRAGKDVP